MGVDAPLFSSHASTQQREAMKDAHQERRDEESGELLPWLTVGSARWIKGKVVQIQILFPTQYLQYGLPSCKTQTLIADQPHNIGSTAI